MKKTLIIISLVNCVQYLHAQQVPSQAEIDKMIQQAQTIANGQQPKPTGVTVSGVAGSGAPKTSSSIVNIPLKQPVQVPTKAQATDKLLWYTGKKMNDSMLVTTKGMVVLFRRKRNEVVVQPEKKSDPFQPIIIAVERSHIMTDSFIEKMSKKKNGFMNYPLVQIAVDEFVDVEKRINKALKNTIQLPPQSQPQPQPQPQSQPQPQPQSQPQPQPQPQQQPPGPNAPPLEKMNYELQVLLNNPPPMQYSEPPKKEFNLTYYCDTSAIEQYKQNRMKWDEQFLGYEDKLLSSVFQIERHMALFPKSTDATPDNLNANLQKALKSSIDRSDAKVRSLVQQYGKNIHMQDMVINAALANERKKQLIGIESANGATMTMLSDLIDGEEFEKYIREQMILLNYDVVFNYAAILGRGRQAAILGSESQGQAMMSLFNEIQDFNRFALTVEVDFQVDYNDSEDKPMLKAFANINSSKKTYVSLSREECKWTLHLSETDYEKGKEAEYYIPMEIKDGTKMVRKEKDKWITYSYTGPRNMLMHFPVFHIDFQDPTQKDTAMVKVLRYDPSIQLGSYANSIANGFTIDMLGYLQHVFTSASSAEMNAGNMSSLASNLAGTFSSMSFSSGTKLEQLKSKYLKMLQKLEMEKAISDMTAVGNATIVFDVAKNSSILIDQETNTAHTEKEVNVVKGIIRLKVVHEPKLSQ